MQGIGIKEIWEVDAAKFDAGLVLHSAGWPLDHSTYGGGWMYHFGDKPRVRRVGCGPGLHEPLLSPFEEISALQDAHCDPPLTLKEASGLSTARVRSTPVACQSLPKLVFPGGALIGCDAGFLNAPRIKGSHAADPREAECWRRRLVFEALVAARHHDELISCPEAFDSSCLHDGKLFTAPAISNRGSTRVWCSALPLMFGVDQIIFAVKAPWTFASLGTGRSPSANPALKRTRFRIRA